MSHSKHGRCAFPGSSAWSLDINILRHHVHKGICLGETHVPSEMRLSDPEAVWSGVRHGRECVNGLWKSLLSRNEIPVFISNSKI